MKNRLITICTALAVTLSQFSAFAYGDDEVNVALNVQSSASSYLGSENSADKANDGINDNERYTAYISADDDALPWWQADLGLSFPVAEIELEARKGGDSTERQNIRIIGANKDDLSDGEVIGETIEDYGEIFSVQFQKRKKVRYIRVEKTSSGVLAIGEIRVFAKKNEILQGAESNVSNALADNISAAGTDGKLSDISGTPYENAVTVLSSLGIMNGYPDGTFRPNESITRAEFTKIAAKLLGVENAGSVPAFSDVSTSHWAYIYVETMKSADIVDGVGNGLFAPEDKVTANQAVKVLVSLLGYKDIANLDGGYPTGYLRVANRVKLLDDVNMSGNEITRGQIAIMVKNAIETDLFRQDTFGTTASGSKIEGETIISENLGIYKDEGIINAVTGTSLTNVNNEDDGYVEINNERYSSKVDNLRDYLGVYAEFWYLKGDTKPYEILVILPNSSTRILNVDARDVISADAGVLEYYDGQKKKKAKISGSADVIYNGYALRDYKDTDLKPSDGSVKLIDNNGDGTYEVYTVNNIDTYVANRVNVTKNAVSVKNSTRLLEFKENTDIVKFINASTRMAATLSDINEWDILSVSESYLENGSRFYNILISDKEVVGALDEVDGDYVYIGGEKFEMAPCFDVDGVSPGDDGKFFLDAYGRVAAYDGNSAQEGEYGFLRAVNRLSGVSSAIQFRIFTQDGIFETLDAHDKKFKIDGIRYSDISSIEEHLKQNGYVTDSVAQPIKFVRDSKNRITSIDTVYDAKGEIDGFKQNSAMTNRYWKNTGIMTVVATGEEQVAVNNDTVMMRIPSDIDCEDDYEPVSTASLSSDSQYSTAVYDSGDDKIAGLVIFDSSDKQEITSGGRLMLVDKVTTSVNEDGETVKKVYGLYNGKYVELPEKKKGIINGADIDFGDVITVSLTAGNLIKSYTKRYYPDGIPSEVTDKSVSPAEPYGCVGGTNDELALIYGVVLTMKDGIITIGPEDGSAYEPVVVNTNAPELKIYRLDSDDETVEISGADDIFDGASAEIENASKVLVRITCRMEYELIIFD